MSEKKRVLLLVLIMAAACMAVTGTTIAILYRAAVEEERDVLVSIAKNHARLIEEFARIEIQHHHPNGGLLEQTTLQQLIDAHGKFKGIGHTGEFTLAKREGDAIVFLLSHRHLDVKTPEPIPMRSNLAEPMRRALLGYSGSMVGLDYRGARVLAAYEPVDGLKWGVVAKVDLAELRIPFARAGAVALGIAAIVILIGALLFLRITDPIIKRIKEHAEYLANLVASLKQSEESLRQARDELELRVEERTAELVRANEQLRVSEKECRLLSRQVIDSQEEERKRVAMELHDSIGQSLAAIKYRAESCLMMGSEESEQRTESLRSIVAMIRDSLEEIRKIQNDLRPAYLDFVGVLESISDLCMRFQATYARIRVDLRLDLQEADVPEFLKAPIFRIVQEAMNNAAKHSAADQITLHIRCKDGGIELSIEDNGAGFELEDAISANGHGKGLGLRGMKERADFSGGHLEFRSVPGSGTLVQAVWPLETIRP